MDYSRTTIAEIKEELRQSHLPLTGNKKDLWDRLILHRQRMEVARLRPSSDFRLEDCDKWKIEDLKKELVRFSLKQTGSRQELCRRLAEFTAIGEARVPLLPSVPVQVSPERPKIFTLDQCDDWTVTELKDKLKELDLPTSGLKRDICFRLANYYKGQLPETKKLHSLLVLEPSTFSGQIPRGKKTPSNTVLISLTDRMYNQVSRPQEYQTFRGKKCQGNAFVFGPLLDPTQYAKVGSYTTTLGQTGLLDYDRWLTNRRPLNIADWNRTYPRHNWNDERGLKEIQKIFPEVMWLGEILGNRASIDVYAHYDRHGDVDSLVIENRCIFA